MALGSPQVISHLQGCRADWEMVHRQVLCLRLAQGLSLWVTLAKNTRDVCCVAGVERPDWGGGCLGVVAVGKEEMACGEEGNAPRWACAWRACLLKRSSALVFQQPLSLCKRLFS